MYKILKDNEDGLWFIPEEREYEFRCLLDNPTELANTFEEYHLPGELEDYNFRGIYIGSKSLNKGEVKYKVNLEIDDRGQATFNLFDALYEMSDEDKAKLVEEGGWSGFISDAMATDIIEGYSSHTYNSIIHTLREKILTADNMKEVIRHWADGMARDFLWQKALAETASADYNKLYYFIKDYAYEHHINLPSIPVRMRPEHVPMSDETGQCIRDLALSFSDEFEVTDEDSI